MKKQLLTSMLSVAVIASVAQQKRISPIYKTENVAKQQYNVVPSVSRVASPSQITAGLVCTGYEAGMNAYALDMSLFLTNTDLEWVDSVAITFPAGITPIGSPNSTFPTAYTGTAPSFTAEAYNGVFGQTISWGDDDNYWGGIGDFGSGLNFRVLVNVTPGLTGTQTATLYLSGDGYVQDPLTQAPGDVTGPFSILPKESLDYSLVNMFVPNSKCTNGANENVTVWLRNVGVNPISSTNLSYSINGGSAVIEASTVTVAPGDTLKYTFATQANLSTVAVYSISAGGQAFGETKLTDNTFTLTTETQPKYNTPYETSFESLPASQRANWQLYSISGNASWYYDAAHTGVTGINAYSSANGASENWAFSPCMNLQVGKTYYIRSWSKLSPSTTGAFSILTGTAATTGMSQVIKLLTPLTPDGVWRKDSISFSVPTTDVYYIGLVTKNSLATDNIDLYIDDIKIDEIPVATQINSVSADEIVVYPNPSNGLLNLYSPNSLFEVEVYNMMGQQVLKTKTNTLGNNQIDLSGLSVGSYTVKLSNDRNLIHKQIVIQK